MMSRKFWEPWRIWTFGYQRRLIWFTRHDQSILWFHPISMIMFPICLGWILFKVSLWLILVSHLLVTFSRNDDRWCWSHDWKAKIAKRKINFEQICCWFPIYRWADFGDVHIVSLWPHVDIKNTWPWMNSINGLILLQKSLQMSQIWNK